MEFNIGDKYTRVPTDNGWTKMIGNSYYLKYISNLNGPNYTLLQVQMKYMHFIRDAYVPLVKNEKGKKIAFVFKMTMEEKAEWGTWAVIKA